MWGKILKIPTLLPPRRHPFKQTSMRSPSHAHLCWLFPSCLYLLVSVLSLSFFSALLLGNSRSKRKVARSGSAMETLGNPSFAYCAALWCWNCVLNADWMQENLKVMAAMTSPLCKWRLALNLTFWQWPENERGKNYQSFFFLLSFLAVHSAAACRRIQNQEVFSSEIDVGFDKFFETWISS